MDYAKTQTFSGIQDCMKSYGHCYEWRTILQVISENLLPSGNIYPPTSEETRLDYILEHVYKNITIKFGLEVKNPVGLNVLLSQTKTKTVSVIEMAYDIGDKVRKQLLASNMDNTIAIINLSYLNETEIPIVTQNIMKGTGASFSNYKLNRQVGAQSYSMNWNNTSMNATLLLFMSNIISEDILL